MSHNRMTVLVVDDEPADLEILQKVLAELGYEVLAANDGKAALQAFHAHRGAIDLLVTDVAMAPMNGCELAANLLKARPDLRVVFVSGYAGTAAFQYRYGLTGTFTYLRKPFQLDDLRGEVAAVALALVKSVTGPCFAGARVNEAWINSGHRFRPNGLWLSVLLDTLHFDGDWLLGFAQRAE